MGSRFLRFLSLFAFLTVCAGQFATADELEGAVSLWKAQAFHCTDAGFDFPSKLGTPSAHDSSICEDADMTLFNGLLCASGEKLGCDAVRESQAPDGRWWRSPRRIGKDLSLGFDVSFSPDQALGVMLYAVTTHDTERFMKWLRWINDYRPCITRIAHTCLIKGWPRYCTDDGDKRCTFRSQTAKISEGWASFWEPPRVISAGMSSQNSISDRTLCTRATIQLVFQQLAKQLFSAGPS